MNLAATARAWIGRWLPSAPAPFDARASTTHCANCREPIVGPFCPRCGQETALALPTARAFLRDAAGRYIAWDARTWRTLAALFFRPGFLTREYLAGRRRRYVRPGRLFVVMSLIFFAVIRFTSGTPEVVKTDDDVPRKQGLWIQRDASRPPGGSLSVDDNFNLSLGESIAWLAPLRARLEHFNGLSREQKSEQLWAGMLRYGPYALIALLPLFAGLMKLLYAGRAQRYPLRPRRYAAHLVFAAHNHAFVCLALIPYQLIEASLVRDAFAVWIAIYFARSMKLVYGGRWSGVILRGLLVGAVYLVLFVVAIVGLAVAAIAFR